MRPRREAPLSFFSPHPAHPWLRDMVVRPFFARTDTPPEKRVFYIPKTHIGLKPLESPCNPHESICDSQRLKLQTQAPARSLRFQIRKELQGPDFLWVTLRNLVEPAARNASFVWKG